MTERLAIAWFVLVLAASFAAAQDSASGGGDFCAIAPQELLVALDGSWSLEQGAGLAVGGVPIPLPAHPPVAMRLEYDAEGGFAILGGQGQQMVMVPVVTETASAVLGDWFEHFATATEGMDACEWYALPTLVGSNVYALKGTTQTGSLQWFDDSGAVMEYNMGAVFCVGDHAYFLLLQSGPEGKVLVPGEDTDGSRCADTDVIRSAGDMSMTISLKFDSPSSARGMLTFMGESDGYSFAAWAPITMTR